MFDCFCFLYIAKIIGEENSVEKQVESARKFRQNVMKKKYAEQAVEYEAEIFKPLTERENFRDILYHCKLEYRSVLIMDIALVNGMTFEELRELSTMSDGKEIILIADGRYVSSLNAHKPCTLVFNNAEDTYLRSYNYNALKVTSYFCDRDLKKGEISVSSLVDTYTTKIAGGDIAYLYEDEEEYLEKPLKERPNYRKFLDDIKAGKYDIAILIGYVFSEDEFNAVAEEIRRYCNVVTVDKEYRYVYLEKSK